MTVSLFRSGLVPRVGCAIAFGLAAFGAVFLLRGSPLAESEAPLPTPVGASLQSESQTGQSAPAPASEVSERIEIESIRPIESWTVRLDGETPGDTTSDRHHWSGTSSARAATLSIDAVPVGSAAETSPAANCLRIRVVSQWAGIEWLEWVDPGEFAVIPLDQLRAGAPAAPGADMDVPPTP